MQVSINNRNIVIFEKNFNLSSRVNKQPVGKNKLPTWKNE